MAETEDKQTNNQNAEINIGIYKIFDLFKTKLKIPDYQRPYEWTEDQIKKLLNDIDAAIEKNKEIPYHIGTIILHKDNDVYDIVDGQQRCISLSLLFYYLLKEMKKPNEEIPEFIKNISFENEESIKRIQENYKIISTYYNGNDIKKIFDFVKNKMQAAVLVVDKIEEAFQLFDSQNTRGKDLYPHDLLKAYHLRSMMGNNSEFDIKRAVISWENNKGEKAIKNINDLFSYYLYPILKWSRREDYKVFTKDNIDEYENATANDCYTYLKRLQKSMPIFQITEPTDNGKSFFEMVEHYRHLACFIKTKCDNFLNDLPVCGNKSYDKAKWLFYCATLMYYDRFACELESAIKKTFTWAFSLYVKMERLDPRSPNKYIRETSNIFYDIKKAKSHTEITRKHFDPGIISEFVNVDNTYKNGNKTKKPSNYDSRKCFYNKIAEFNNLEKLP